MKPAQGYQNEVSVPHSSLPKSFFRNVCFLIWHGCNAELIRYGDLTSGLNLMLSTLFN